MSGEIARVHVNAYDMEVFTGRDALLMAETMASQMREDFGPNAIVGVSYNQAAAESNYDIALERVGIISENQPSNNHEEEKVEKLAKYMHKLAEDDLLWDDDVEEVHERYRKHAHKVLDILRSIDE